MALLHYGSEVFRLPEGTDLDYHRGAILSMLSGTGVGWLTIEGISVLVTPGIPIWFDERQKQNSRVVTHG